ncbi:FtsW/RodA/SpoVE family cell cycle protein [Candidatus Uhrbacteria bacterium]|nr:FtsW/RodA/SpoVE family cell cycle protein [Candidatus Uhrbacteria bacterium]
MRSWGFMEGERPFILALGVLVTLGLVFLSSASAPLAYERFGSRSAYVVHQLVSGVLPGIVAFCVTRRLRTSVLQRAAIPLLVLSIVLLLLVFVPGLGESHHRTRSWLSLGPVTFQPAEIAKLGAILAFAAWATVRRPSWFDLTSWTRGFFPFLGVLGVVLGLIAFQPDPGTMSICIAIAMGMAIAAGLRWSHLAALVAGAAGALAVLIAAAPYRLARLTVFLHPELDPRGIGYQVNQALLAVGSGGIIGVGLGHSRQKFSFLPEVISDSIFAIIAEEVGFLGSLLFLAAIAWVIALVVRRAMTATDAFERLVLVGIATWWGAQSVVNIGAIIGLMPLTGLPLPFVSYGGTSMVMALAAAGIVARISANDRDGERARMSWRKR